MRWLRDIFRLDGRATRAELWSSFGLTCVLAMLFVPAVLVLAPASSQTPLAALVFLVAMSPLYACMVRRGHDLGWSAVATLGILFGGLGVAVLGRALAFELMEVVGVLAHNALLFVFALRPGELRANAYGSAPVLLPRRR